MPKFVLHVVEGSASGQRISLADKPRFTIGRKATCDLSLPGDEKISGTHCEIVPEGDVLILRDLESTNGTRVDGKRIQEIPISHGDRFQVGQTLVELVDEAVAGPVSGDDMGLRIDAQRLARARIKSPVALLLLVLIVAVGVGAWFLFLSPQAPQRRERTQPVVAIPGNLLGPALAHAEEGGSDWLPLRRGQGFARARGGHTGEHALRCDLSAESGSFGTALPAKLHKARLGGAYRASAWFRTEGDARVAVRLCFFKAAAAPSEREEGEPAPERFERSPSLVVGSKLAALPGSGWHEVTVAAAVPPETAEVGLALIAVLDAGRAEAHAFADDVSLLEIDASGVGETSQIKGRSLIVPDAQRGSLCVHDGAATALAAVSALPADGTAEPAQSGLSDLAAVLALPLNDVFDSVALEVGAEGAKLRTAGTGRVVLHVDEAVLEGGSYGLRRTADGGPGFFDSYAGDLSLDQVTGILWGGQLNRVFVVPAAPVRLVVEAGELGRRRFVLSAANEIDIRLLHEDDVRASVRLCRRGDDLKAKGDRGEALAAYGQVLREKPFDSESVAKARQQRGELLAKAGQVLEALQRDFDEAREFHYDGLYREILARAAELDPLEAELGPKLGELKKQVQGRLAEVEKARSETRGARLLEMARALQAGEQTRLAGLLGRFVVARCAGTEAAKAAEELIKKD